MSYIINIKLVTNTYIIVNINIHSTFFFTNNSSFFYCTTASILLCSHLC